MIRVAVLVTLIFFQSVFARQVFAEDNATPNSDNQSTGTITGTVASPWVRRAVAVVYIKNAKGEFKLPEKKPIMDQIGLRFTPHLLPVLVGSTVSFPNSDTVRHNVYSPAESAKQFNLGVYPPKSTKDLKLEKVGVIPLRCNVHSEMAGYIVVLPNPFFAVTDKKGKFTIKGIPAGSYELTFWHEKLTPKTQAVTVTAGSVAEVTFSSLKRGDKYSIKLD